MKELKVGARYEGNYDYGVVNKSDDKGKIVITKDRQRWIILDIKKNYFSAKISYFYNKETKEYGETTIGMGVLSEDNSFILTEFESNEMTFIKGQFYNNFEKVKFVASTNSANYLEGFEVKMKLCKN